MASLKITRASGEVEIYPITPSIEVAFERHAKGGFSKVFREEEKATHIYYLAWEAIKRSGEVVALWDTDQFLDTLKSVEVVDDNHPNG